MNLNLLRSNGRLLGLPRGSAYTGLKRCVGVGLLKPIRPPNLMEMLIA
jgi:hypothetical protein